jgi:hypothetical protein
MDDPGAESGVGADLKREAASKSENALSGDTGRLNGRGRL